MIKNLRKAIKEKLNIKKIESSDLFDPAYYLETYPDVKNSSLSPAAHYYKYGWKDGKNPSLKFNTSIYLQYNLDVEAEGVNPLIHYISRGIFEERNVLTPVDATLLMESKEAIYHQLKESGYFSETYYKNSYPDVYGDPIEHYIKYGAYEGRNPSSEFNSLYYLENNPDVEKLNFNPLQHWILHGRDENRKALPETRQDHTEDVTGPIYSLLKESNFFAESYYKEQNPDVLGDPVLHYLNYGAYEGRNPSPSFHSKYYLENNPDVANLKINPLEHWILYGQYEGRKSMAEDEVVVIEKSIGPTYQLLKDSTFFSESYYIESNPSVLDDPIEHYIKIGAYSGCNPSPYFDSEYYLKTNPDVANLKINPLEHWLLHGKSEGRKIRAEYIEPSVINQNNTPTIIFVSHEASATGAPAVLLSLMTWLKKHTKINFSIVVGLSGPWDSKFSDIAPTLFLDQPHTQKNIIDFCGNHVQAVYINTIVGATFAKKLDFLHAEYVTHVHEMENLFNIFENDVDLLKSFCNKYIAVSPGSIESINKRMPNADIKYLKPFINKYSQVEITTHPCFNKKIIFGCGAVEKRKGFDLFCAIAKTLKDRGNDDFELHWIGSDINLDLDALDTIEEFGVAETVKFLGPKANPRDYFKFGDVFLLTSREDPYPLVCMEAAEFELPVVCFDRDAGGMHTFVEDDAGIVVPYLDVEKMSDAVETLITDNKKRKAMGEAAKLKVERRHYVDVIAPQILDYLPESAKIEAASEVENYKALISKAEVVSFDIFDTLVTRVFSNPETVFDIAEYTHTKNEAGTLSLFDERMKTAGKVLGSEKGAVDDISIDKIYEKMPLYRNSTIEKEAEIDSCITHHIGKELYDYAISLGKKIYITSDMYLDRATIETILINNGFEFWDEFFLSSERGKKKDTGKLFTELKLVAEKSNIKANDILHIGDNWLGDIKFAREAGIRAVRFSPLYESQNKMINLDVDKEQKLSQKGKIWSSFTTQATRLWAEENPELATDFYTKLGFELTGPLASMMAMHSKQLADSESITKIVFMARDGRIIKKAFDTLYNIEISEGKYESLYLHLSRATVVAATFEPTLTSNDLYFLLEGLHLGEKNIAYFLDKANLNPKAKSIQQKVTKFFVSVNYIPNWGDFSKLSSLLESLSGDIYAANEINRKGLQLYLQENEFLSTEKLMIVDVGWLLNIQSRLTKFIENIEGKTKIIGSYVGTRERVNKSLKHSSLLYNLGEPSVYSRFLEENVTLFEVLFSSPEPSASAIVYNKGESELKLKPLGVPLPKEHIVAQKLHMGAEAYFEKLNFAQQSFFPKIVSKDYFFSIFEALVNSDNDNVKAELGNFEVRLGGHHEFVAYQDLIKRDPFVEYKIKEVDEYFKPITYDVEKPIKSMVIVTSAGLTNGSTRYRALNLAESLQFEKTKSIVIHSLTPIKIVEELIANSNSIVFQRCFTEQGNVGAFLALARKHKVECIGEIDDLVFPAHIDTIGSVKGGQWSKEDAMFVAKSYESFLVQMDNCFVSTIALKEFIESTYDLPCKVRPNKISYRKIRKPVNKKGPVKLIYASGTYSHKEDFELIEGELFEFLTSNSDVTLSILGAAQSSERVLALPNVNSYPLLPYNAMLEFISKFHLMLVPLVNDVFNNAKSNVKFVEAGGVGVPVLASGVREYEQCIDNNYNGQLFSSDINLEQHIKNLSADIANNANIKVSQYFSTKPISMSTQYEQ